MVPLETQLRNHGRRDERGDGAAYAIESVEEPKQLVGFGEVSDPGVPRRIPDTIAKPCDDVCHNEGGVRRVLGDYHVGQDVCAAADDTDAPLSKVKVQVVVQRSCADVADEG